MEFRNSVLSILRAAMPLLVLVASISTAATTPLEVFGHLPSIEDVAISPDGTRLALVRTKEDQRAAVVISLTDGKIITSQKVADAKLRGIYWADNDNLLMEISTFSGISNELAFKTERWVLASLNMNTGKIINPLSNVPDAHRADKALQTMNLIIGSPQLRKVDGHVTVFVPGLSMGDLDGFKPSLFKFKAGVNISSVVERSEYGNIDWLLDESGSVIANQVYNEDNQGWTLTARINGKLKQAASGRSPFGAPSIDGLSPNGDALWLGYVDEKSEKVQFMAVSFKDGTITDPVPNIEPFETLIVDHYSPRVLGGRRTGNPNSLEFFDTHIQESWDFIHNQFQDENIKFISASDDFKKIVFGVEGTRDGYAYMLFDDDTYKFKSIGRVYDGLGKPAEVKPYTYQAADKLKIPGYLTLPVTGQKNLPLIVLPHGGPESYDTGHFDWMAQAFAAQGYAVLQPNFRGSDNTIAHRNAGFGEWGRKMQTDLSDGVRALVKEGVVDAKRVCIVGGSYGGYAALAAATLDPEMYRCAVSIAGISDLSKMRQGIVSDSDRHNSLGTRYFDRYLGATNAKDPVFNERSPALHAEKADIPILLIHGKDDSVVPYEQSQIMADALHKAHKVVEFATLKHEDHWLSHSDTRLQMLQVTVDFLLKNNPPN